MVYAPLELRMQRVAARDGLSYDAIRSRINNQMPDEEKKACSDYVIYNDGKQALVPQLTALIARWRQERRPPC
jgi:dephospho-CoA kinase